MTTTSVLSMRQVSRTHGRGANLVQALMGVDLDVVPGELVAIMGPSGSGKSTLLQIAGGLDAPTSGEVVVEGRRVDMASPNELAELRRVAVGYVFQDINLIPALTTIENVALPLELGGTSTRAARVAARDSLSGVGLIDVEDRFPDELSGGQRQLVAIARALIGDRRLILADEPTGALDSRSGEDVLKVLRERVDAGAAGVLVTHDPRQAGWADRVLFLRDGCIVESEKRG